MDLNVTTKIDPENGIIPSAEITYHINTDNSWLSKLDGWGDRRAPGKIQIALSDLIKAHANYKRGLTELEGQLGVIQANVDILKAKYGIYKEQIVVIDDFNKKVSFLNWVKFGLFTAQKVFAYGQWLTEALANTSWKSVPKNHTSRVIVLALAPAIHGGASTLIGTLKTIEDFLAVLEGAAEPAKEQFTMSRDRQLYINDARFEVQQMVKELETMESDVRAKLQELYTLRETIHQAAGLLQASLAEGERLLAARDVFRKRAAGDVQDYRYEDMAFRVFRNDGVQKYRATFELAARYAYLAATAYDYETNLLGSETDAGRAFLTSIVRRRSPGVVMNGVPVVGARGLADPLAKMRQNFEVYQGQLGFNNPQIETNRFSLRKELFRLKQNQASDPLWQAELGYYYKSDLWGFPPFKRFCRPFADEAAGPQPGIVIPFSTEVNFGYNFFGWPLGAGDSAYDPSNFATKIRSVGVWFEGYDTADLSSTPRVYLVPVGADVLRAADADNFVTREFHVVDQKLPVPFPVSEAEVADETWIPVNESLSDVLGGIRRFSSFRAFPDPDSYGNTTVSEADIIQSQSTEDTRLIGRSVWNTQWLLIIPGGTLLADPDAGLDEFINNVTDIKLFFQTYAYSGN